MASMLKYIKGYALTHNVGYAATDSTNWAINEAFIKSIKVVTDSTEWSLQLGCDVTFTTGMFSVIYAGIQLNGNQTLLLDLPYIDDDDVSSVHLFFYDHATLSKGATVDVYGQKARIA